DGHEHANHPAEARERVRGRRAPDVVEREACVPVLRLRLGPIEHRIHPAGNREARLEVAKRGYALHRQPDAPRGTAAGQGAARGTTSVEPSVNSRVAAAASALTVRIVPAAGTTIGLFLSLSITPSARSRSCAVIAPSRSKSSADAFRTGSCHAS